MGQSVAAAASAAPAAKGKHAMDEAEPEPEANPAMGMTDSDEEDGEKKSLGREPPPGEFLDHVANPSEEMNYAASVIQARSREKIQKNRQNQAATLIQELWASTNVALSRERMLVLHLFLLSLLLLFLAGASASAGIYYTRIRFQPCDGINQLGEPDGTTVNPFCGKPHCGDGCESHIASPGLEATNYIMMAITIFICVLCALGAVGAARKNLSILRFFSFALLVLIALELSLLLVFTDAEKGVSMEFKREALNVYADEYCVYKRNADLLTNTIGINALLGFNSSSDLVNITAGNITGADLVGVCSCIADDTEAQKTGRDDDTTSQCVVDWFDENLYEVVYSMLCLIALEILTSWFAWTILAKPQDFAEMVDGHISRARKKHKDQEDEDDDARFEAMKNFRMPPEAIAALRDSEGLVTDTWYFEATVVFSVVLAMYVLALDSPASPPEMEMALLLRVIEIFVTVFLSVELALELIAHISLHKDGKKQFKHYLLNPWTLLDILVLVVAWFYLYSPNRFVGVCRALRVLRPMRTIRIFESVQIVGRCLVADAVVLRDVLLLTTMLLAGFALVGLTCFHGVLQYTCVRDCSLPCEIDATVQFNDLFLTDQYNWDNEQMGDGAKSMWAYLNAVEKDSFPKVCTASMQSNRSYHVAGVCGAYYESGHKVDIKYEKSTRQRFEIDMLNDNLYSAKKLVVSCPQTLRCAGKASELDGFPGDDFIFQIYQAGGLLNGEAKAIESELPDHPDFLGEDKFENEVGKEDYPLRMKPQYGRYSWYGRNEDAPITVGAGMGEDMATEGVACVKLFGDPYARGDLPGVPSVMDGMSPKGQKKYGYKGGAPRVFFPGNDDQAIRGFDNIQEALLTMLVHLSGDNGMHVVPIGLQDSDAVQGWLAWGYFAISGIILCFVTLNLLLAVCCSAFSDVSRIMKEKEKEKADAADPFLKNKGSAGLGDVLASAMKTGGMDSDGPFHGTTAMNEQIMAKDWTGKRCHKLRQLSHTIVIKHGHIFREVAVIMVLIYTFLIASKSSDFECDTDADPNCLYPVQFRDFVWKRTESELRTFAETILVLFFILEFVLNILSQGWKLYLRRQENVFDTVVVFLTVIGTIGTYLEAFEGYQVLLNQQANASFACQTEGIGCTVFTSTLSDTVSPGVMRALRLGRIAQLFRMLYKHKPMFEVMVKVFKSWKAIMGVTVFSIFTVCMFTIICMHLMGGGRGPPKAECQDPMFCTENGRNPSYCINSFANPRGAINNIIVTPSVPVCDSTTYPTLLGNPCGWLPMWMDTVTGSITDINYVGDVEANGDRSFDWEGSNPNWEALLSVNGKPDCSQFNPTDNPTLYAEFIAGSDFPTGAKCIELTNRAQCEGHGRCKVKEVLDEDDINAFNFVRLNEVMCKAQPDLYEWAPLLWVEAVTLEDYPRQNFETFNIGLLTQLMVMLGDDWSEVMMDYMNNSAIGGWAAIFMSVAWLGLHGILYSMFVAVLLINFSTEEDAKMPEQRAQWHHANKLGSGAGESAILKQMKIESGEVNKNEDDDLVSKLANSYDPDHAHRSFYIFNVNSRVRNLTATIEQHPRTTELFLLLVALSLVALTMEGGLTTEYDMCIEALAQAGGSETGTEDDDMFGGFGGGDEVECVNGDTECEAAAAEEAGGIGGMNMAFGATSMSSMCFNAEKYFRWLEKIVFAAFFSDMLVKSITNGWLFNAGPTKPYLRRPQNRLNFIALAMITWTFTDTFEEDYGANKVRLVRGLAPMVALLQNESINDVVVSFLKSLPGVATVITPMLFIGLMFAVIGVEYFGARLRYCVCPDGSSNYQDALQLNKFPLLQNYPSCPPPAEDINGTMFTPVYDCDDRPGPGEMVHDEIQCDGTFAVSLQSMQGAPVIGESGPQRGMEACLLRGYAWINPPGLGNFDDITEAGMMLFKLASSGYVGVMEMTMDITDDPNNVSVPEASEGHAFYFVMFHAVFNFFLLNLFIGVMSSTFSVQTGKAIVTEGQKRYTQAREMLLSFDPVFTAEEAWRPVLGESNLFDIRSFFFNVVTTNEFHWTSTIMIFANMILLCSEHYPISPTYDGVASVANMVFLVWFALELLMKLLAFGTTSYFGDNWLSFDALIVVASLGLRFGGLPAGVEVFKVLRCCKMLFLAKSLSTLIDLMHIVAASLVNAFDVVIISLVIFYVYATMGNRLFGVCGHDKEELNINNNFESFTTSAMMLFQIMCGQQYTGIIAEINQCMIEQYGQLPRDGVDDNLACKPPICAPEWNTQLVAGYPGVFCAEMEPPQEFCGEMASSQGIVFLYFATFYFLSVFIATNLFIVSVLDSFDVQSLVDQEIDRFDMWGFTYAWAELTIGAHACPALTRYEAKEFCAKLAEVLDADEHTQTRTQCAVKIEGVPARALTPERMQSIFMEFGDIAENGVAIKQHDPSTSTGGWAIITFNDRDNMNMVECLSSVRTVDGIPVLVRNFKDGGKFANGMAHLKVPGLEPQNNPDTGTMTIQVRALKGFLPEEEPYVKVTLVAKHKHHGGHDVAYQTRSVTIEEAEMEAEGGMMSPRSPGNRVGAASPRNGADSPSLNVGKAEWDYEKGSVFYGDTFRFHINEHTAQFRFEVFDIGPMTHTSLIGVSSKTVGVLKDCIAPTTFTMQLHRKHEDGTTYVGGVLEVEVCFSLHTYVPDFHFLGDFIADNSAHKERDSSGIEGWLHKKAPDHMSTWDRTWVYIAMHPEPCLRVFEGTPSEHHLEGHGKSNQLLELTREFSPHQITGIQNGFDHHRTDEKERKHVSRKHKHKAYHRHGNNAAQEQLEHCEFQFEIVDELEDGKGEDTSEEDHAGLLHIHLIEAEGLPQMDLRGLTDAYVHAHLLNEKTKKKHFHMMKKHAAHKSAVVENTLEPKWDEAWTFKLHKATTHVHFQIADSDPIGRDDPIGEVVISIADDIKSEERREAHDQGTDKWDVWFDIQPVKKGPKLKLGQEAAGGLGRIHLCFKWCSPLDASDKIVSWSAEDHEMKRIKQKREVWRFRAMSTEHKYAWVHALTWLSGGCQGQSPKPLPPPPLHREDVRLAVNNVALIDLPFIRLRHLLYNLHRFKCFKVKNTRDTRLYTMFQLETHAFKTQLSRHGGHVVVHRSGLSAQTGLSLSHIRGLNYHLVMERLALMQYGKSESLPYSRQMAEYEMEKNSIAIHVIQTCLHYWVMMHHARKTNGRLPKAAYWRRTNKDIELAKRESSRLKESLKTEKMSALRKRALEYGVPQVLMDDIDDNSADPHTDILELVLEYCGRQDSKTNTGRTKMSFFIGALGVRNLRLHTLRRLKLLIKKNDPLVVYGDPNEDLKEKLYTLAHADEFEVDPMAPSDGPGCMNRRKLKQIEMRFEKAADDAVAAADNLEKQVEKAGNMVGDMVDEASNLVENNALTKGVVGMANTVVDGALDATVAAAGAALGAVTEGDGMASVKKQEKKNQNKGSPRSPRKKTSDGEPSSPDGADIPTLILPAAATSESGTASMETEAGGTPSKKGKKGKKNEEQPRETELAEECDNPVAESFDVEQGEAPAPAPPEVRSGETSPVITDDA